MGLELGLGGGAELGIYYVYPKIVAIYGMTTIGQGVEVVVLDVIKCTLVIGVGREGHD